MFTYLRVPVRVVEDDGVGRGEVHAHAARARGDEEDEEVGPGGVEAAQVEAALHAVGGAVEARVLVAAEEAVVLQDVEHGGELREEEDAVAVRLELGEHAVEEAELPRGLHHLLPRRVLRVRQQVRVVAALPFKRVGRLGGASGY